MNRIEGQIWIDRKPPYSMKYYVNGREHEIKNNFQYKYVSDSNDGIYAGTLVTLEKKDNGDIVVKKAVFPKDILRVAGVVTEDVINSNNEEYLSMSHEGYVEIHHPDKIFTEEEITYLKSDEASSLRNNIIGAPVYWYIGRDNNGIQNYNKGNDAGKLTLRTPSDTVIYNNLPIVGFVSKVNFDETFKLTFLEIHLNFSTFDTSIEWSYKKENLNDLNGISKGKILEIYHGLFLPTTTPESSEKYIDCTMTASLSTNNPLPDSNNAINGNSLFNIIIPNGNIFDEKGGYSWIYIKSNEKNIDTIKVNGSVSYDLKNYNV